jgi:hypothetical protein
VNEEDRGLRELPGETWYRMIDLVLSGTYRSANTRDEKYFRKRSGSIILAATVGASGATRALQDGRTNFQPHPECG